MVLALSLILFLARSTPDAAALLSDVDEAARAATTWRVEGHVTFENGSSGDFAYDFRLAWRAPDLARYETDGATSGRTLVVCDGATLWTYSSRTNHYTTSERSQGDNASDDPDRVWLYRCAAPIAPLHNLATGLVSAKFVGHETLEVNGQFRECDVVRAEYRSNNESSGRLTRTMCIDAAGLLILRDRIEAENPDAGDSPVVRRIETITYGTVERDGKLADDLFYSRRRQQARLRIWGR